MNRTCKVVIGFENLLIWNDRGEYQTIPNFMLGKSDNPYACPDNAIPVHAIHCGREAPEHQTEIFENVYGGAHGTASQSAGTQKKQVDIAYCPEHHQNFLKDQRRLEQIFKGVPSDENGIR